MGYPMYIVSEEEEEEEEEIYSIRRDWLYESQVQLCKKKTNHKEYLKIPYWKKQQLKHLHLPLYDASILTSPQLYENSNTLTPKENYIYNNKEEKDDNNINEVALIN